MRLRRTASGCAATLIVALACVVGRASDGSLDGLEGRPFGLADVQTIYVAEIANSDDGKEARSVLADALRSVGFRIADSVEESDAVLGGLIATKPSKDGIELRFETAVLRTADGETLWFLKLRSAGSFSRQSRRLARGLREDVKQAVWDVTRDLAP